MTSRTDNTNNAIDPLANAQSNSQDNAWLCRNCHAPYAANEIYCSHCGSLLPHVKLPKTALLSSAPDSDSPEVEALMKAKVDPVVQPAAELTNTTYFHDKARLYLHLNDDTISFAVDMSKRSAVIGRLSSAAFEGMNTDGKPIPTLIDLSPFRAVELGVSRQHAQLDLDENILYITDLNSANGTFINSRRLPPRVPHALANRTQLQLGRMILRVHYV